MGEGRGGVEGGEGRGDFDGRRRRRVIRVLGIKFFVGGRSGMDGWMGFSSTLPLARNRLGG